MIPDFSPVEWDETLEDDLRQIVRLSVREDLDRGQDWTTVALVGAEARGTANVVVREAGILAGLQAAVVLIDEMQADITCELLAKDGENVEPEKVVARLTGSARDLLTCERPLLNLLGRLSGIATLTNQFVQQVASTQARVYDTRKTLPAYRRLEKYAVRCGGGLNHRTGLFDAVLIKDNHLAFRQAENLSPAEAIGEVKRFIDASPQIADQNMLIEIELDDLESLPDVLQAGPNIVLLDNMTCVQLEQAVATRNETAPEIQLEASGGVDLSSIRQIAETGVDRISVGAITHSAVNLDVGLDWAIF